MMKQISRCLCGTKLLVQPIFFMAILTATSALAATIPLSLQYEVEGVEYMEEIPRPEEVLGHIVGTRHTRPDQIEAYFRAVAAASDRVTLEEHGSTYEGRPLIHAIVAAPRNQDRLEEIRRENRRLSDTPSAVTGQEIESMPVIAYMGYSVHGNEASGSEAALLLLYHLAAGEGEAVDRVLSHSVVLIDPMLNPDGRGRFVQWVNSYRGGVPNSDPSDREHNEPWPGGRTNHYWFDLNRDWLPAQLKESRGRLDLFHSWRPQLHTDFHEMGSNATFFFQPGVPSRNNPNIPQRTYELTREIASFHARYLDEIGSLYYSEEGFDDFYFGKGSTYPDINGGVGILFEQASSRALIRETNNGILTYDFTIRNQFVASLSSLDAAVSLRQELLNNCREFYAESRRLAEEAGIRAYVFDTQANGRLGTEMLEILERHRIQVHRLAQRLELDGKVFTPESSFIVAADQPQYRLLKVLMERVTEFGDSTFYDVSTWSLPLALGVEVGEMQTEPGNMLGEPVESRQTVPGELQGGRAPYAYLLEWDSVAAPQALFRFQQTGLITRLLKKPALVSTQDGEREFERGTVIIPVRQRTIAEDELHTTVQNTVVSTGARMAAAKTGRTSSGPDLGGPSTEVLRKPVVAILSGSGTSSYQAGETWFLLTERLGIPASLIELEDLEERDLLGRYNTLILPGLYGDLAEPALEAVRQWTESGNLLIAYHSATARLIETQFVEEKEKEQVRPQNREVAFEDLRTARRAQTIPGSIFEVRLDNTHPVAFGAAETVAFLRDHTNYYLPSETDGVTVGRYTESPLLSGYVADEQLSQLSGSAALFALRMGSGRVVLFADNPNFRAFWYGTSSLFINALFFGSTF